MRRGALALVALVGWGPGLASAREVAWVDASGARGVRSIQQAVDGAADGAWVLVAPGLYPECVDLSGRSLRLVGVGGAAETLVVCGEGVGLRADGGQIELAHLSVRGSAAAVELVGADISASDLLLGGEGAGLVLSEATARLERSRVAVQGVGLRASGGRVELREVEVLGGAQGVVLEGAELFGSGLSVHGQRSVGSGGALVVRGGQVRLLGCALHDAVAARGAGLWVEGGAVELVDCALYGLRAGESAAGGIVLGGSLRLLGSTVRDAEATSGGAGGFSVGEGSALELRGSALEGLRAVGEGGAVASRGALSVWDTTFSGGSSGGSGGGLAVSAGSVSVVSSGFVGLRAEGDGGAAVISGVAPLWSRNEVVGNAARQGGGLAFDQAGAVSVEGGVWSENTALGDGGALWWVDGLGALTVRGGLWQGNTGLGGGALDLSLADVQIEGARLVGNAAFVGGAVRARGGGFALSGSVVRGNEAVREAGGLAVVGARFAVTDSLIAENVADRHGGLGLWSSEGELLRASVCGNRGADGGGVFAEHTALALSWTVLALNLEGGKYGGAGALVRGASRLIGLHVTWLDNRSLASDSAGLDGLHVGAGAQASLSNSVFSGHDAYYFSTGRAGTALSSAASGQISYGYLGFWENGLDVSALATDPAALGVFSGPDPQWSGWSGGCGGAPPRPAGWLGRGDPLGEDVGGGPSTPGATGGLEGAVDQDGDGAFAWDGDCDDADALRAPGLVEVAGDGVDQDCDGADALDADGDGFDAVAWGGTDCDDNDPAVHPLAEPLAGVDASCAGLVVEDLDGDGVVQGDCEPERGEVYPGAIDRPYDGLDQDCDGASDFDADGDGSDDAAHGGEDCDDARSDVYPGADEEPYDGVDQDCAGGNDRDADGDGQNTDALGGNDCDDGDAAVFLGADEVLGDGRDNDCDGLIDEQPAETGWGCAQGGRFGPWWVVLIAWRRRWVR